MLALLLFYENIQKLVFIASSFVLLPNEKESGTFLDILLMDAKFG